jgi:type II secretory pathway component PulM
MDFVFVGGIVLLVLLGPWVLVWRISSRRKRERDEDNERWQELSSRTYALEQTVRALQAQRPGSAAEEATPKTFLTSVSQTQISNLE